MFSENQTFNRNLQYLLRIPAFILFMLGAYIAWNGLTDTDLSAGGRVAAVAIGAVLGLGFPVILWTMHMRVRVNGDALLVRLWPLPLARSVPLATIVDVEQRKIDAMGEYGGWGVKGKSDDLLFSVGGSDAVSVTYESEGGPRRITITSERSDELADELLASANG